MEKNLTKASSGQLKAAFHYTMVNMHLFDCCYNYIHLSGKNDLTKYIEKNCLSPGFYLAILGMFRGSGFMLEKNSKNFESLLRDLCINHHTDHKNTV